MSLRSTAPFRRTYNAWPEQLVNDLVGTWMAEDYRDCLIQHRSAFSCRSMGDGDRYTSYMV